MAATIHNTLLDAIGNTPLVKINFDSDGEIYAKLEYLNPSGSIKDRSARYMIEKAEKLGLLKPGGTIIEASSGNQGITTAMIAAIKGYKAIITVSEKVSQEKKATLKAYGAEIVICPPTKFIDDPESYHTVAMRIHKETPNSYILNQYFNLDNREGHYKNLGPELWQQTNGKITHFCAAVGTGGTTSGVGTFLKEQNKNITVLGVDSPHSYRSTNGNPKPYAIEGMGVDFDAPNLDDSVIDGYLTTHDADAINMLKELACRHGFLVGPASGAVAHAVKEYAKKMKKNDMLVMLFTDSGRAYLTKGFYE